MDVQDMFERAQEHWTPEADRMRPAYELKFSELSASAAKQGAFGGSPFNYALGQLADQELVARTAGIWDAMQKAHEAAKYIQSWTINSGSVTDWCNNAIDLEASKLQSYVQDQPPGTVWFDAVRMPYRMAIASAAKREKKAIAAKIKHHFDTKSVGLWRRVLRWFGSWPKTLWGALGGSALVAVFIEPVRAWVVANVSHIVQALGALW